MYLIEDNWDDWFKWSTLYALVYVDSEGKKIDIGSVKIGEFDMEGRRPKLPTSPFTNLNKRFFSVGQDASYYENLNSLGETIRSAVLKALKDIAFDSQHYTTAMQESVTRQSLLRSVSVTSVQGQFRRLAHGNIGLTNYRFRYTAAKIAGSISPPMNLTFEVEPESNPPSNLHVLIGRNGVGKTHLLNNMINTLIDENATPSKSGTFDIEDEFFFASLVSVSFSAFDTQDPLPERKDKSTALKYAYIGLKRLLTKSDETKYQPKSTRILKNEFIRSIEELERTGKTKRWKKSLELLEADPNFKEAEVSRIADIISEDDFEKLAGDTFQRLSSGHKIVLLTITRLIETVEERTLVLIDEPEGHLHPPLLSSFIRVLSNLLIQKNGVAIVATHSPVILQEVPRKCVWKLRRAGAEAIAERPEVETFGENVGILTREVFGLAVTNAGFHKILINAVDEHDSYEDILAHFDHELGLEARAIVKSLLLEKNQN